MTHQRYPRAGCAFGALALGVVIGGLILWAIGSFIELFTG